MIDELFADTVVICHHEKLFTSPSIIKNSCKRVIWEKWRSVHGSDIWKKRYFAGPLDCKGEHSLVFCTGSGNTPGNDLCPFRNEIFQGVRIFIINGKAFIGAEAADLPALEKTSFCRCGHLVYSLSPVSVFVVILPEASPSSVAVSELSPAALSFGFSSSPDAP